MGSICRTIRRNHARGGAAAGRITDWSRYARPVARVWHRMAKVAGPGPRPRVLIRWHVFRLRPTKGWVKVETRWPTASV